MIFQDEGIDSDYQEDVQDEDSDRETDGILTFATFLYVRVLFPFLAV